MDGKLNLFQVIAKRMDWLGQRQTVLAENIANADTPEFVPQDLSERDFRRVLRGQMARVDPVATDAAHLRGTASEPGAARTYRVETPYETSPSGNAVILEEQLVKIGETQTNYQMMTNLYRKHMEMFRMALRGN
jgi:flagellar basal-body rod protein FlgB